MEHRANISDKTLLGLQTYTWMKRKREGRIKSGEWGSGMEGCGSRVIGLMGVWRLRSEELTSETLDIESPLITISSLDMHQETVILNRYECRVRLKVMNSLGQHKELHWSKQRDF